MNLLRVRTLVAKEVSEALRDRLYLTLAFFLPVLLMLVFTYGMTSNIDNVGVVIVDEDQTPPAANTPSVSCPPGTSSRSRSPTPPPAPTQPWPPTRPACSSGSARASSGNCRTARP
jgi:hypothetical protein